MSDGVKIYSHIPQDKQVIVSSVPADDQATSPAMFLAGKGDIVRDFSASYVDSTVPGTVALKLTPRRSEPDYEYLVVAVDPASLQMRALTTRDRQGGESTLIFNNLKENQGISDKEFAFRIPRGVDVITDGSHELAESRPPWRSRSPSRDAPLPPLSVPASVPSRDRTTTARSPNTPPRSRSIRTIA